VGAVTPYHAQALTSGANTGNSPTYVPTRRYHSRTFIHPSLDMEAFSISSALYMYDQFSMPLDPCGPTAACCGQTSGAYPLCSDTVIGPDDDS